MTVMNYSLQKGFGNCLAESIGSDLEVENSGYALITKHDGHSVNKSSFLDDIPPPKKKLYFRRIPLQTSVNF